MRNKTYENEGLDKEILDIICCPKCKSNLEYLKEELSCKKCNKKFKVKNGIPILLLEYLKR